MVTKRNPRSIRFFRGLTSLGRERDRWIITIPADVARLLNKDMVYCVELRPQGSVARK